MNFLTAGFTGCLKCTHCSKTLSPGNYASMGGVYYCKPHFKQLFALKGKKFGFSDQKRKTCDPLFTWFTLLVKFIIDSSPSNFRQL